ncbi:MAG TPA: fatty acid desaturase, partial [Solimonas sp.]|nr:fatty acid desaturase [Solimonas sp.]
MNTASTHREPASPFSAADKAAWRAIIETYRQSSLPRAVWQLGSTVALYAAAWALMYFSVGVSWWLTVPLAILAGGLLVRIFIIFHDCG